MGRLHPPLPYIKNTTRNLQFNESQFIASPGQAIGVTTYVTTADGYTWAAMSTAVNAMWPYDSANYSGLASQSAYYAGNIVVTPPEGVVKLTANYKGQNMKFWANENGLPSDDPNAIKLDRYFVIDEWGNEYIMHASGVDQNQVATAFDEAILPQGWTKEVRQLSEDLILTPAEGGNGSFHYLVFRDSADNTYHQTKWSNTGSLSAQVAYFPIWGGQDDNILFGDANGEIRDDLIYGAAGDDTFFPGLGNDVIWGDAGVDTVVLSGNSFDCLIEKISSDAISTFTVSGFGYTKTLYDVENLQFDNETIFLNNHTPPDEKLPIFGTPGDDQFVAAVTDGYTGAGVILFTGAGNDEVDNGDYAPGIGDNRVFLGSDADEIFVANGDRVNGDSGDDIFDASAASGYRLSGGEGDDLFFLGADGRALGGAGDDRFFVGTGGKNLLAGGAGADQFWLLTDAIPALPNIATDFTQGVDVIGIMNQGAGANFANLSFSGNDIKFNGDVFATLSNFNTAALTAADFVFA